MFQRLLVILLLVAAIPAWATASDLTDQVTHHFADSDGVKIHYVKTGEGPMILFIHGFPDFWYSWREQMKGLASDYTVVALDTRGYNKSDQPEGVENYDMSLLVEDVAAVIKAEGQSESIIVGHDWGGAIAWSFAAAHPELTDKLVIVNLPHPKGLQRELKKMDQQHRNSQYARNFQRPDSHQGFSAEAIAGAGSGGDPDVRAKYVEAFKNSSFDAMMNYYRANYPREPYDTGAFLELPVVKMPVLQFHGLTDSALLPGALNDTWNELEQDWTLVTLPGTGHWSHVEKSDLVTDTIRSWLKARQ